MADRLLAIRVIIYAGVVILAIALHFYLQGYSMLFRIMMMESGILETFQNGALLWGAFVFFRSGRQLVPQHKPAAYFMSVFCLAFFAREVELVDDRFHEAVIFLVEGDARLLLLIPLFIQLKGLFQYKAFYLAHWRLYLMTASAIYMSFSFILVLMGWPLDRLDGLFKRPALLEEALECWAYFLWVMTAYTLADDEKNMLSQVDLADD